jgi:hypothetical protein
VSAGASDRRLLLERAAADVAAAWVGSMMDELRTEGRAVAGGWPGTLREGRGRVRSELALRGLDPTTFDELEQAVRQTYALARRRWLVCAEHEDATPEASP